MWVLPKEKDDAQPGSATLKAPLWLQPAVRGQHGGCAEF